MDFAKRVRQRFCQRNDLRFGERTARELVTQRLALHQLHHDKRLAMRVAYFNDLNQSGMSDPGQRSCFFANRRVTRLLIEFENLDRKSTVVSLAAIDAAHSAVINETA